MASLIGFDINRENVEFREHCELSINFISNYLYITPVNEAFKLISASFQYKYVMKKNLLFVFAEHSFMDFCLVFNNEQICKKILDYINSGNDNTQQSVNELSIDDSFIVPFLQKISNNPGLNTDLIETIATWHQLLDEDDRDIYTQMMKEYGIYVIVTSAFPVQPQPTQDQSESRKRSFAQISRGTIMKNKLQNKLSDTTSKNRVIRKPGYEIFDNCVRKNKKFLIIFDPNDRSHCYEYIFRRNQIFCHGCWTSNKGSAEKSKMKIHYEGIFKEYVEIINDTHQCQPCKFQAEKYRDHFDYVLKPDFEIRKFFCNGKEKQRLIIFDGNDRSKCYRYFYCSIIDKFRCGECKRNGKFVTAKLHRNAEGEEYVILSNVKHACEMKTYISNEKITIHPPDFALMEKSKNELSRIFFFAKNDPSKCYIFTKNYGSFYGCAGCKSFIDKMKRQKKKVCNGWASGKLIKDEETGSYSFQMKANQTHSCTPRSYQPEKYESISTTSDFFYYCLKNDPKTVKLAIYSSENKELCYTFAHEKARNYFVCIKCRRMKKQYSIKPQKDADRKEFYNHNIELHICEPIKVSSIPKSDILKEHGLLFERRKITNDKNKIVKKPDFEIRSINDGILHQKLIIHHPTDKTLCYEYYFVNSHQNYQCSRCQSKKTIVTAKLHTVKENGETFIVMGKNNHICEPMILSSASNVVKNEDNGKKRKVQTENESKIVRMPEFELRPNKDGVPDRKLVLRHPNDKTLCYEYYFTTVHQTFRCGRCQTKKKGVSAKLHKNKENGECFIVMGKNDHACEPVNYQPL